MENKKWLISWIGKADHLASGVEVNREAARESDADTGEGPIATALLSSIQYDRVCLLTNYGHTKGFQFCEWVAADQFPVDGCGDHRLGVASM